MISGISWHTGKASAPVEGDAYYDEKMNAGYIYLSGKWEIFSQGPSTVENFVPTKEQLEKHPALKQAWEEYLVIKRLIGV